MDYLVILLTKIISRVTTFFGGGTNLPGEIALKLRPHILKTLAKGYRVILVTGTNGKTTTTSFLQGILKRTGKRAISSVSGANLKSGVASCFIQNFPLFHKVDGDFAVLEVDEAYMRHVTAHISPEIIAVTNIFRDQLDRFGEVDTTLSFIEEACKKAPSATLVLNADEAMLGDFLPQNPHYYYGFRVPLRAAENGNYNAEGKHCKKCHAPYQYAFRTFNHLGAYQCAGCGFQRPYIDFGVDHIEAITADNSVVSTDGLRLEIPQPGAYNIYNALCAAACAKVLKVPDTEIVGGIKMQESKFGRQETIQLQDTTLRIILIKNPAGAEEAIRAVLPDKDPVHIGAVLNDNYGDGTDISWIYDVEFEQLCNMQVKSVLVGGVRRYDMGIRLRAGGLQNMVFCNDYEALLKAVLDTHGKVYMFMTYTAMIQFRKFLYKKKYIKKLWF